MIVIVRLRYCDQTKAYMQRRLERAIPRRR